jgi:hypothetical protein
MLLDGEVAHVGREGEIITTPGWREAHLQLQRIARRRAALAAEESQARRGEACACSRATWLRILPRVRAARPLATNLAPGASAFGLPRRSSACPRSATR